MLNQPASGEWGWEVVTQEAGAAILEAASTEGLGVVGKEGSYGDKRQPEVN